MRNRSATGPSVSAFLSTYPPAVRALAQRVRTLLGGSLPQMHEQVYPGWKIISIGPAPGLSSQTNYIAPFVGGAQGSRVVLGFTLGARLADPHGLLGGNGALMRRVVLNVGRPVPTGALRALMAEALAAFVEMQNQ